MSDGYVETILVEANQTSADTSSNTPATWTNTLSDVIHMKAGDKVSLYAGFISDKGAGNTKTIEVKGKSLKKKKTFVYTELVNRTLDPHSNLIKDEHWAQVSSEIELKDNEANIILNYYKTTNGTGYVGLPRKFVTPAPAPVAQGGTATPFSQMEDASTGYLTPIAASGLQIKGDFYQDVYSGEEIVKINNDNSKFTLFISQSAQFGPDDKQSGPISDNTIQPEPEDNWTIAPEYKQYYQYREYHKLTIPSGFNSAQFISDNLTKQLQQVTSTRNIVFPAYEIQGSTADFNISKVVESRSYKTFQCANINTLSSAAFTNASNNVDTKWYNGYHTIAIKRPELYETGNFVNMNASVVDGETVTQFTRLLGSRVFQQFNNGSDEGLVLSIPYNASNLIYLRDFINAQENYPEIWESFDADNPTYDDIYNNAHVTINNTRYFHINQITNASQIEIDSTGETDEWIANRTGLGSSNYKPAYAGGATSAERISRLFLVYYNASDKNIYYDDPTPEQYSHGCFRYTNASFNGTTEKFITIYPNKSSIDTLQITTDILINGSIEVGRKVGYDQHFTAPTTCAISLFNGKKTAINYYGEEAGERLQMNEFRESSAGVQVTYTNASNLLAEYLSVRYVGADNPSVGWDGEHFFFDGLHTPENLGNRSANGGRYGDPAASNYMYIKQDVNDEAGSIVYKINPEEDINEYCPAIQPYQGQFSMYTVNGSIGAGLQYGQYFNRNYKAYEIFDSKSGIFIEDFGFTEDTWDDSLWGILGFSYEQFHSETNNRVSRVDNSNINGLKYATTNAEVKPTDTKSWNTNDNSVSLFTDNIPSPFTLYLYTAAGIFGGYNLTTFPSLNIKTQSLQLVADNFPTSMSRGYYNIRSDIIPRSSFVGGSATSTNMPIVGLVNKENPQNDFYFGGQSGVDFTITKDTILSSISVSIHDPDGTFSNVDNNSSIVFQIQRPITTSFNIAQEILQDEKNK